MQNSVFVFVSMRKSMGMATSLNKWDNRLGTMGNIYGSIDNGGNLWTRLARETGKILGNCTEKYGDSIWGFPKMGVSNNGWFVRENPIKRDDFGGSPPFQETSILKELSIAMFQYHRVIHICGLGLLSFVESAKYCTLCPGPSSFLWDSNRYTS